MTSRVSRSGFLIAPLIDIASEQKRERENRVSILRNVVPLSRASRPEPSVVLNQPLVESEIDVESVQVCVWILLRKLVC